MKGWISHGVSQEDFKDWVIKKAGRLPEPSSQMTIGQFTAWLLLNDRADTDKLRRVNKTATKGILERIFDIPLANLRVEHLKEALPSSDGTKESIRSTMQRIKSTFLTPAVGMGFLFKEYDLDIIKYKVAKHKKNKEQGVVSKTKTVGWYAAERYLETKEDSSERFALKKVFLEFWDTNTADLKDGDFQHLTKGTYALSVCRRVLDKIYQDEGLSYNPYSSENKPKAEPYSFSDNTWTIKESEVISRLHFDDIEPKELRALVKHWISWRVKVNQKDHKGMLRELKGGFLDFLTEENLTLKKFTNTQKRKWALWLSKKYVTEAKGKRKYRATKQFLIFCSNAYRDSIHKGFRADKMSLPYRPETNKVSQYFPREIAQITDAIKRHNNKQFSSMLTLILLTAKRKGEILSLKTDCLIEIAGIKYLKYSDSKNNREMRVPLQSFEFGGEGNLFQQDVTTIVSNIVKEQLKYRRELLPYCKKEDEDFLFLADFENRTKDGFRAGRFKNGYWQKEKQRFLAQNGIRFPLLSHKFRQTLASAIIRSGEGIETASRILGNQPKTVSRYYEADVSKYETLMLPKATNIDAVNKAKELLQHNKTPTPVTVEQRDKEGMFAVYGGSCMGGIEVARECKYYNMLFSAGGCLGCAGLAVTPEEDFYYENLKEGTINELEENSGTPFASSSSSKLKLIMDTLVSIRNIEE